MTRGTPSSVVDDPQKREDLLKGKAIDGEAETGGGVGLLHTFAADGDPGLVRVLPEVAVPRAYWLVVHAELRRLPRVRAVADFLEEAAHAAG